MEIEQMRIRMGEMAAEIERLQSIIDEANAQLPVTSIQVSQGYAHIVSHSVCNVKDGFYKVYTAPIPAQQSPAVAVPDIDSIAGILEKAVDLYSHKWSDEFCDVTIDIMKKGMGFIYPEGLIEFAKQIRAGEFELHQAIRFQSPRITEHDAESIIESYVESPDCFNDWIKGEGRALLTKLNKPSIGG